MLMSRYGVSDGRFQARDLWGEYSVSRWGPVAGRLSRDVLLSPRVAPKAAFSNLAVCADTDREVAS